MEKLKNKFSYEKNIKVRRGKRGVEIEKTK